MTLRQMLLTPELVARVPPYDGLTGKLHGRTDTASEEDHQAAMVQILAGRPPSENLWIFAYGSLIWSPGFDHVETRLGTAAGWRRSFCLGWVRIYRGTPERPGLMLALERGGSCRGVLFRLPPEAVEENLLKVLRREMPIKRDTIPARWMSVRTEEGPLRAIGFPIHPRSPAYLRNLESESVVHALATAAGERGSMAEYLYSTVRHLEDHGVHDRYLWRMQALVAERIAELYPASSGQMRPEAEPEPPLAPVPRIG